VLALVGDIATKDGRASVHCHVVVDRKDFHGGWSPDGGVYGPL
jgi:predicted DNA-binding protein with PD1-like motif